MADALHYAWHDGRLQALEDVRISPLDRGFLFGDGIYEVIPVYDGRPLALDRHLARLHRSCDAIALPLPEDDAALAARIDALVEANGGGDQSIYLQLSRGGDRGRDHRFPPVQATSLFAMSSRLAPIDTAAYRTGVAAITLPDQRWARCDIKSTSLLANVLARQAASEAGAAEALLVRDGELIEGAASAVGCIVDGVLVLPPEDYRVLPSVTRALTVEVANRVGVTVAERPVPIDECRGADEILLMSSTREIVPVATLDGAAVGSGRAGPVWERLFSGYQAMKSAA